jgi:hypothetical protein
MKLLPAIALCLAPVLAAPALADDHAEANVAAFTIDTPIEALLADDAAKAVVVKHLGELGAHPSYGQFKTMSLVELQPWSMGQITDDVLAKIKADLAAL